VWCGMGNVYGQVQELPPRLACDKRLVRAASSLESATPVHVGLICTGDKFITACAGLDAIKSDFSDGLAVDMESAAIAQVCYLYHVPFISFRIISDTPGADDHWQQYESFWDTMADRSFGVVCRFLESLPSSLSHL
ncbi:MAG: 5'-methylthioadenosine/S-adenosylhomocysteine nucleosidase, partial [Paraprevotella sp.]|nr:5'-methylthioadenosine/S-adenosylhomocysteine nucleosidase [Paraprevotella sp.]